MNDPDAALVRAVAEGDANAARELMDRHLARILRVGRRMLGDAAEAEDVAQEVFLRVWRNAAKWKPGRAKFETWMHRVAINLCLDRLRRRREVFMDAPPDRADHGDGPDGVLLQAQTSTAIEAALARLPERQRAAIVLCHYQELTNIEAAAAMSISVEAVESLLSRGRRKLREELADLRPYLKSSADRSNEQGGPTDPWGKETGARI